MVKHLICNQGLRVRFSVGPVRLPPRGLKNQEILDDIQELSVLDEPRSVSEQVHSKSESDLIVDCFRSP